MHFYLETNTLTQNKLIVAHVLAHCDFFKNNVRFSNTRRDMVESMTATAERIASYERSYGKDEVEQFLDAVLSIQEHIDPSLLRPHLQYEEEEDEEEIILRKTPYDDLWSLDEVEKEAEPKKRKRNSHQAPKKIFYYSLSNIVGN